MQLRRSLFGPALALWLIAEFSAFFVVAQAIGLFWALVVGVSTSFLGFALLRENVSVALERLRAVFDPSTPHEGVLAEGLVGVFGASLLIVPGFLSDLVGLVLTIPSVRKDLALKMRARETGGGRDAGPAVLELNRAEWSVTDASSDRKRR
jgi:UPF0716 protein FxsA